MPYIETTDTLRRRAQNAEDTVYGLHREREELKAEIERLRAALKPFAKVADRFDGTEIDSDELIYKDYVTADYRITLGQCRAARAALNEQK